MPLLTTTLTTTPETLIKTTAASLQLDPRSLDGNPLLKNAIAAIAHAEMLKEQHNKILVGAATPHTRFTKDGKRIDFSAMITDVSTKAKKADLENIVDLSKLQPALTRIEYRQGLIDALSSVLLNTGKLLQQAVTILQSNQQNLATALNRDVNGTNQFLHEVNQAVADYHAAQTVDRIMQPQPSAPPFEPVPSAPPLEESDDQHTPTPKPSQQTKSTENKTDEILTRYRELKDFLEGDQFALRLANEQRLISEVVQQTGPKLSSFFANPLVVTYISTIRVGISFQQQNSQLIQSIIPLLFEMQQRQQQEINSIFQQLGIQRPQQNSAPQMGTESPKSFNSSF